MGKLPRRLAVVLALWAITSIAVVVLLYTTADRSIIYGTAGHPSELGLFIGACLGGIIYPAFPGILACAVVTLYTALFSKS